MHARESEIGAATLDLRRERLHHHAAVHELGHPWRVARGEGLEQLPDHAQVPLGGRRLGIGGPGRRSGQPLRKPDDRLARARVEPHLVHQQVHEREPAAALGHRIGSRRDGLLEVSAVPDREDEGAALDARREVKPAVVAGQPVFHRVRDGFVRRDGDLVARLRLEARLRESAVDEPAALGQPFGPRSDGQNLCIHRQHVARSLAQWSTERQPRRTLEVSVCQYGNW